jgi:hypothetical protein
LQVLHPVFKPSFKYILLARGEGIKGGGRGSRGEMTETMYAHMNK